MKYLILIVSVLTLSASAFSGVARVWHLTYENNEVKCAIDIVKLTNGKFKSEVICFSKI